MGPESLRGRYLATMTPKELVKELLDAAVYDLEQADRLLGGDWRDAEALHRFLLHAQAIFAELRDMLPRDGGDALETKALMESLAAGAADANALGDRGRLRQTLEVTRRLRLSYAALLEPLV